MAFTDSEKMREAKDMVKEKTAAYATTISSNTKNLANKAVTSANKAVTSAQQSPPVPEGHARKGGDALPPPHFSRRRLEPCVEFNSHVWT
jgi:hypothetical protein